MKKFIYPLLLASLLIPLLTVSTFAQIRTATQQNGNSDSNLDSFCQECTEDLLECLFGPICDDGGDVDGCYILNSSLSLDLKANSLLDRFGMSGKDNQDHNSAQGDAWGATGQWDPSELDPQILNVVGSCIGDYKRCRATRGCNGNTKEQQLRL